MKIRYFCVCQILICLLILFPAFSQEKKADESAVKEWEKTLRFGIETEIIDVVKKIKDYGEESLNPLLLETLSKSINPSLRTAILNYFTEKKYTAAEGVAFTILKNHIDEDPEVVRALISYLSEVKSMRSLDIFVELVDAEESLLANGAIQAIGTLGDTSQVEFLLKKLHDSELKQDRKPTIIKALGVLKAKEALSELIKIVNNKEEDKIWRMYACESLGKIGVEEAIGPLKSVLAEKDPLLRAYAASALANFDLNQVIDVLIECLKDSSWKVRLAACSALARPGADKALEILIYKVNKDPENVIKTEAIKTLAAMNNPQAFSFLRDYILDQGKNTNLRDWAVAQLLEKNLGPETVIALEKLLKQEWNNKEKAMLEATCKRLMTACSPLLKPLYLLMLEHQNYLIRVNAIRGIAANGFADLKARLEELAKKDSIEVVRKEAESALSKFNF